MVSRLASVARCLLIIIYYNIITSMLSIINNTCIFPHGGRRILLQSSPLWIPALFRAPLVANRIHRWVTKWDRTSVYFSPFANNYEISISLCFLLFKNNTDVLKARRRRFFLTDHIFSESTLQICIQIYDFVGMWGPKPAKFAVKTYDFSQVRSFETADNIKLRIATKHWIGP